ncbi:MAG: hypothetical protein IJ764_04980 [Bacteroidales bacterium]|nr:hypothetical protein [Bacteroidales bacterium]
MKRQAIIFIIALLATVGLGAQDAVKSPFVEAFSACNLSVDLQGGIGSLLIDNQSNGSDKTGTDFGAAVGFTYMFDQMSGIHTGLGITFVHSGYKSETVSTSYREQDIVLHDETGDYTGTALVSTTTHRVDETYTSAILSLPIQYAFRYNGFWVNAGMRLSLPLSINASYTYGYSTAAITYFDLPDVSFVTNPVPYQDLDEETQSGTYKAHNTSLFVDLSLEAGYRFVLNPVKNLSLYVGLYFDYALNRFGGDKEQGFLTFDGTDEDAVAKFNGALNSSVVNGYGRMAAGLKVSLNFGLGRKAAADPMAM